MPKPRKPRVVVVQPAHSTWLREAISDDKGLADITYIAVGVLMVAALAAVAFIGTMQTIDYIRCNQTTTVTTADTHVTSVVTCRFDPLPFGQACGLIFAAFASLITSLGIYLAANKRAAANNNQPQGQRA